MEETYFLYIKVGDTATKETFIAFWGERHPKKCCIACIPDQDEFLILATTDFALHITIDFLMPSANIIRWESIPKGYYDLIGNENLWPAL